MRHAPATMHFSHAFGSRGLPARGRRRDRVGRAAVARRLAGQAPRRRDARRPWDATRPAELDAAVPSQPFREPVNGLAIREVNEPDVFRHFFGA